MKKTFALAIALVMILGCVPVLAEGEVAYKNIKIDVNDERIILLDAEEEQQKSIIANGQIYVPIECFINAIGGKLSYDETENLLSITIANVEMISHAGDAPAEKSAINKLTEFEKQVYDALLIMLEDFYNPSSVRVLGFVNHDERSKYINSDVPDLAGVDNIIVHLSAQNRVGGTADGYYLLSLSTTTWDDVNDFVAGCARTRMSINGSTLPFVGTIGDYREATEYECKPSLTSSTTLLLAGDSIVGNINAALKEHWSSLGIN